MTSLATYNPFMNRPTYKTLVDLPVAERAARMRLPEVRDQILGEQDEFTGGLGPMMGMMLGQAVGRLFSLAFPVDYEPDPSQSVKALARAQGLEPLHYLYDRMTEGDGTTFFALLGNNFSEGTLEPCREMLLDPNSVSGLSDAGAHVMMISDCSSSTFHLTHWVRDRTKGDRVPLELAVHKLTGAPAEIRAWIREMKQKGELWRFAKHRRGRWLNNRVEQDHRRIKRLTRPMLGFRCFWTAKRTLAGIEAMAMLAKGQVRAVPRGDMPAQRSLVQ